MNEENIKKMIDWVENSSSFIQGEIPDYINQLLRYTTICAWFNIGILSILIVISTSMWIWCLYKHSTYDQGWNVPTPIVMGCFFPGIAIALMGIGVISEIHDLIKLYIAPKVYILKHLTSLLK